MTLRELFDSVGDGGNCDCRILNCLHREKISSIEQLVTYTAQELLLFPDFGEACISRVRLKLGDIGMALRNDTRQPTVVSLLTEISAKLDALLAALQAQEQPR